MGDVAGWKVSYPGSIPSKLRVKEDRYLHAHSRNLALVRRKVTIFERCEDYLKETRTILDWGCHHAVDACLVRMLRGTEVELHGCDVDAEEYRVFYEFSPAQVARRSPIPTYCPMKTTSSML